MPKISVIIPVYKAENFIAHCLDSVLSQTFQDFEIIAVDDGSPDASYSICQAYARKDARIHVLHQENQGQASARNHALEIARGQWLCYVDSDDIIHPQMLEFLYRAVMEGGAGVSMCQFLEAPELPETFWEERTLHYTLHTLDDAGLCEMYDREQYPAWVACAKLIARELVERYPFTVGRVYEDNEAVCRWICQGEKLAWLPHDLYFYRTNLASTTQSSFSIKKLDYLWALESIIRFFDARDYTGLKRRFADRYIDAVISACYGAVDVYEGKNVASRVERQARKFLREQKIPLTGKQRDALVDAAYPTLAKVYWPVAGVMRRVSRILNKRGENQ